MGLLWKLSEEQDALTDLLWDRLQAFREAVRSPQVIAAPSAANLGQSSAPAPVARYVPPPLRPNAAQAVQVATPPPSFPKASRPTAPAAASHRQLTALPGPEVPLCQPLPSRHRVTPSTPPGLDPRPRFQYPSRAVLRSALSPAALPFQSSASRSDLWTREHRARPPFDFVICPCGLHRKDVRGPAQTDELLRRIKDMHLCNDHHLRGFCRSGPDCASHHKEGGLSVDEFWALSCVARQTVCLRGPYCDWVGCVYGHHCTFRDPNGHCRYGDSREFGGRCIFSAASHCTL